jgi:hypothetical protein
MSRINRTDLSDHFQVALALADPDMLEGLLNADRYRRLSAVSMLAGYLADRMLCFDIAVADDQRPMSHPSLFPDDLSPLR